MDYKKHYDRLINRAKVRKLDCYTEKHHIVPKCMNGTDNKNNLVNLTAREHFIAHLLLFKIYNKDYKLIRAINMMCVGNNKNRIGNRMYGWLKEIYAKTQSEKNKGNKNSQFGKKWIYNYTLKSCKKINKNENIENGWTLGRVFDFSILKECKECGTIHKNKLYCSNHCSNKNKKGNFKGKKHTENVKLKISEKAIGHTRNVGSKNPMFGMRYIHNQNTLEFKKCKGEELKSFIKEGWIFGKK